MSGVRAVITGYNTPEIRIGFFKDNFALKRDKVRQFRDEVAAVAATDPDIAAERIVEQMEGKDDILIKVAVQVKDSDIMVDLAGSSPQVDWGGNVVFNFTYAYVFMAMKSMFDPDILNNDGCTAPIAMEALFGKAYGFENPRRCLCPPATGESRHSVRTASVCP